MKVTTTRLFGAVRQQLILRHLEMASETLDKNKLFDPARNQDFSACLHDCFIGEGREREDRWRTARLSFVVLVERFFRRKCKLGKISRN